MLEGHHREYSQESLAVVLVVRPRRLFRCRWRRPPDLAQLARLERLEPFR